MRFEAEGGGVRSEYGSGRNPCRKTGSGVARYLYSNEKTVIIFSRLSRSYCAIFYLRCSALVENTLSEPTIRPIDLCGEKNTCPPDRRSGKAISGGGGGRDLGIRPAQFQDFGCKVPESARPRPKRELYIRNPRFRQGLDLYDGLDSRPSYRFRQGLDLYDGVILRLGEGRCEVMTDPGGIRAEKRGLALLVICIPTRKQ